MKWDFQHTALLLVPVVTALVQGLVVDGKFSAANLVPAAISAGTVLLAVLKQFNDAGKAVTADQASK